MQRGLVSQGWEISDRVGVILGLSPQGLQAGLLQAPEGSGGWPTNTLCPEVRSVPQGMAKTRGRWRGLSGAQAVCCTEGAEW